jgi:hypothetical protein
MYAQSRKGIAMGSGKVRKLVQRDTSDSVILSENLLQRGNCDDINDFIIPS